MIRQESFDERIGLNRRIIGDIKMLQASNKEVNRDVYIVEDERRNRDSFFYALMFNYRFCPSLMEDVRDLIAYLKRRLDIARTLKPESDLIIGNIESTLDVLVGRLQNPDIATCCAIRFLVFMIVKYFSVEVGAVILEETRKDERNMKKTRRLLEFLERLPLPFDPLKKPFNPETVYKIVTEFLIHCYFVFQMGNPDVPSSIYYNIQHVQ
jgi:hypothetical protein